MNQKNLLTFTIIILTLTASTTVLLKPPVGHTQSSDTTPLLTVTGLVTNPLSLTLSELQAMPQTTEYAVLYCVADYRTPLQFGNWTGVTLSYLLQIANVSVRAIKVAFFAPDGYSADLTVQIAMQNDILLAYEKNNASLSGLQLVVPGNWGYKWITNPNQIQLMDYNFQGTTESEGYPDDATISNTGANIPLNPQTTFYSPQNATSIPSQTSIATTYLSTPSPAPTATSTAPAAASRTRSQSTSTIPVSVTTVLVIVVVCAATSAIIWASRKKEKSRIHNGMLLL